MSSEKYFQENLHVGRSLRGLPQSLILAACMMAASAVFVDDKESPLVKPHLPWRLSNLRSGFKEAITDAILVRQRLPACFEMKDACVDHL